MSFSFHAFKLINSCISCIKLGFKSTFQKQVLFYRPKPEIYDLIYFESCSVVARVGCYRQSLPATGHSRLENSKKVF